MTKGFTLLELLISIFVIVVAVVAAISLIQQTISFMSLSSSKLIASYLAQEGIEVVRNIRDGNWLQGQNWDYVDASGNFSGYCSSNPCRVSYGYNEQNPPINNSQTQLYIDGEGFYGYNQPDLTKQTKFTRKITIEDGLDPGSLKVSVSVTWQQMGPQEVKVQENLYSWYTP